MLRRSVIALAAFIGVSWAFCVSAVADAELLVYSRPRTGLMLRTGSSEERLAYNQGAHLSPRISPDGSKVLFSSYEVPEDLEDCGIGLWVVDTGGTAKKRVCDGEQGVWSPDGVAILFQRSGRLVERELGSGTERVVGPEEGPALAYPTYAGDAGIVCADASGERLYLLGAPEKAELELLAEGEFRGAAPCSPDGTTLAYQDGAHIHLLDLATRETRQLTLDPGVQAAPVWAADGQGLCYAWAVSPFEPLWEIRHVAMAAPWVAHRVERRVHAGFDWRGSSPEPWGHRTLRGGSLTLWRGLEIETRQAWKRVPPPSADGEPIQGGLVVENDWLDVFVSADGVVLVPQAEQGSKARVVVSVEDLEGKAAMRVSASRVTRHTADEVDVEIRFSDGGGVSADVTLRVPRTRPAVEVHPGEGTARVRIDAAMTVAVAPDWFGNDLVVTPDPGRAGETVALPRTPVALGCLAETGGTLMVVAPGRDQAFAVTSGAVGERLTGLTVSTAGEGVAVAVLAGRRMWPRADLAAGAGGEQWRVTWDKPFQAAWRLAVHGEAASFARTWDEEALGRLGQGALPVEAPFDANLHAAVIYAWGRDAHTPEDVLMPVDVLVDVLGIRGCAEAFDVAGVRGYRTGLQDTSLREVSTRGADWRPWISFAEQGGYGVLEVMAAAFPAGTPGTRLLLTHLGNDAIDLLRGLDARIGEYEEALGQLAAFCHARDAGALAPWAAQAEEALRLGQGARRTDAATAARALEGLLAILGTRDNRRLDDLLALCELFENDPKAREFREALAMLGAKEGRLWHDDVVHYEISYEDEFEAFWRCCRRALGERQRLLERYRAVLKHIRDAAGRLVTTTPQCKEAADELRAMTQAALRNRQFLEGDWRGEKPLEPEAAP